MVTKIMDYGYIKEKLKIVLFGKRISLNSFFSPQ